MLAVLPLDVSVSSLFKRTILKARTHRQFLHPANDRNVDTVWGRIADDKAHF